jgi:hypothetical protein
MSGGGRPYRKLEFVHHGTRKRTKDWACALARIEGSVPESSDR